MQAFVDRTFYRLEYDYQETVKQISESMRSLIGLEDVKQTMMRFALEPMFIDSGCIMLRDKDRPVYTCTFIAGEPEPPTGNAAPPDGPPAKALDDKAESEKAKAGSAAMAAQRNSIGNGAAAVSIDAEDPLITAMAERKKEATIYDIVEDPAFEDVRGSCMGLFDQLDATLMVPLIFEDKLTGILALGRKKSGKFYRPEDINLLNTLANQGAIAIENARMIMEVIEKERMEEELSIAHDMQMSMLPEECPQIEGADMAAFSQPAREVGGDFYDFLVTDDGCAGIVIGDVTGKSVSGALVMSASRSIFRMLAEEKLSVREMMIRANRRAKQDTQSGMFIALLYAHLNPAAGKVTLCSAGQTQPILCAASDRQARLVETQGDTFPLGIIADVDYQETVVRLGPGDCLILYTDGIVEAENEKGEMLGFDRLLAIVEGCRDSRADRLLQSIIDEVNAFVGDAPQHDDLTVIAITRPPDSKTPKPSRS
jgi:serine phosphatase RsbU (regulator of sigma subunit)